MLSNSLHVQAIAVGFQICCSCGSEAALPKEWEESKFLMQFESNIYCAMIILDFFQYFNVLCSHTLDRWVGEKYNDFPPFNNNNPNGPQNFLPCAQWLWDVYSQFMEAHWNLINQHMAMQSATIIAINHSHKVHNEVNLQF